MALLRAYTEWHNIQIAPNDIPEEDEPVLVTTENFEGTRRVLGNVFLKQLENDTYCWCTYVRNDETMLWEKVIAWTYYPNPYVV